MTHCITRRDFHRATIQATASAGPLSTALPSWLTAGESDPPFALRDILGSPMYGYTKLAEILPEVTKIGATAIDIWPKKHGDQREQVDQMGADAFAELLESHNVRLGCITRYDLGPFGLKDELKFAERFGCKTIVTGSKGPRDKTGSDLKQAVADFCERMKPHVAAAEEAGVTIAIENHGHALINSPDSMKWLAELAPSDHLGIALAPYHLPQDEALLAKLITDLGNRITMFYAWEHGNGCMEKLPKEQELLQMPARGPLEFGPLLAALKQVDYNGWTEIFMHPVPRGIPILDSTDKVTEEINRSRKYLAERLATLG